MAKKRRGRPKKVEKQEFKYSTELNGIILILIAIIGIPPLGLVGKYIKAFAMFLMGNFSIVFLVMLLYLGLYMIFKRKLPNFFTGKLVGFYIFLIVILTFTHLVFIEHNNIEIDGIVSITLNSFKDAVSNGENAISVGGGMIGAVTSYAFIKLFDVLGSKIVLSVLGFFSLILFFDLHIFEKLQEWKENRPEKIKKKKGEAEVEAEEDKVNIYRHDDRQEIEKPRAKDDDKPVDLTEVIVEGSEEYTLPTLDIFDTPPSTKRTNTTEQLKSNKVIIEQVLNDFQLYGRVVNIHEGPAVTQYEVEVKSGTKLSRITNINKELALALAAKDVRIMAPIPGKSTVGIEIPNRVISTVPIKEVLASIPRHMESSNILVVLGKDLMGNVMTADLTKMPHLLVAGSTGSGKSVCINSFIASILMRYTYEEVKLVLVDPKKVELSNYGKIPHLMYPVVTDPKQANIVLKRLVEEMERRYEVFNQAECKNIQTYNAYLEKEARKNPEKELKKMPYIVAIIDELADLMLVAAKEVEDSIMRITQMARAAGIHLIVATQRPSTDVITGIVKANIPSRISFAVSSGIDSRTILDMQGAEKLLGKGDMLYLPMGENSPIRIQGTYISDNEIKRLIDFVTKNRKAVFDEKIQSDIDPKNISRSSADDEDEIYQEAVDFAIQAGKISASLLQRKFRLGFNRAARIMDMMEERGIVGPQEGSKSREVLVKYPDEDQ